MARGRFWTQEEIDRLLSVSREHTINELTEMFGRSFNSIKQMLFHLNVHCKAEKRGRPKSRTKEDYKRIRHDWYEKNKERLAEYQKAYYEELKKDEVAYEIFKLKHNERKRKNYARKKAKTNNIDKEVVGRSNIANIRVRECIGF